VPETHRPTARVVAALRSIAASGQGLTLSQLASQTSVAKSTLFPIMHTLRDAGWVVYDEATQRYRVGPGMYELGASYLAAHSGLADVKAIMTGIVAACGETCYFGRLAGDEVSYLLAVDSPQPIRMVASVGNRLPAHSTAIGKALLSRQRPDQVRRLYPHGLRAMTANTITNLDVLIQQLDQVRREGLAYETEESTPHICCVAVPLIVGIHAVAAVSVATPVFRFTPEKKQLIVRLLLDAKPKLERIVAATPLVDEAG
jgi:DNA-binding IclR family transcriptional regulator